MINREKLYDLIYEKADRLFKEYNPCEIGKNIFGKSCCRKSENFCCRGCRHLSDDGCTVRSLACKLCLCCGSGLIGSLGDKLHKLRRITYRYNLYGARMSKEELFAEK